MADVTVTIPAEPLFIHLLRSVVASVAARQDFLYDTIDDLRMAVDEAATFLLQRPSGPGHLTLTVEASEAGIEGVLASDAEAAEWPPPDAEDSLSWKVLSALVEEADFRRAGDSPAIRFYKRSGS